MDDDNKNKPSELETQLKAFTSEFKTLNENVSRENVLALFKKHLVSTENDVSVFNKEIFKKISRWFHPDTRARQLNLNKKKNQYLQPEDVNTLLNYLHKDKNEEQDNDAIFKIFSQAKEEVTAKIALDARRAASEADAAQKAAADAAQKAAADAAKKAQAADKMARDAAKEAEKRDPSSAQKTRTENSSTLISNKIEEIREIIRKSNHTELYNKAEELLQAIEKAEEDSKNASKPSLHTVLKGLDAVGAVLKEPNNIKAKDLKDVQQFAKDLDMHPRWQTVQNRLRGFSLAALVVTGVLAAGAVTAVVATGGVAAIPLILTGIAALSGTSAGVSAGSSFILRKHSGKNTEPVKAVKDFVEASKNLKKQKPKT